MKQWASMENKYLMGIDIGSSGSKVTLLDIEGKSIISISREYHTYYPKPGWAEQDPGEWIKNISNTIRYLFEKRICSQEEIIAVGISGVTHAPLLLDKERNLLGKVMHITDARSYKEAEWLRDKAGDYILQTCLNNVDVGWTIAMLLWIKNNDPERLEKTKRILFPKDYVRFKLTGTEMTDIIDAQGSMLFNPIRKRWDKDLIGLLGIKPEVFPETANPQDIIGAVTREGSSWSGLKEGTPVIAGTTDTVCEVFAARSLKPGDCTIKLATFGRVCVITDKPYFGKGLINYSYIIPGLWYPGTGTRSFGSSLRWFRNQFCKDMKNSGDEFAAMDQEARNVQPTSGGLLFHPYLQGEGSPYDDPYLRGDFIGLTLHHTRGHLIRALLEGTAFSILDCMDFIKRKRIKVNDPVKFIGGGAKSKLWTEILADVLGRNASMPQNTDPSVGVALLSGVGIGIFKNVEESIQGFRVREEIQHDFGRSVKYKEFFKVYKKAKKNIKEINHTISENYF